VTDSVLYSNRVTASRHTYIATPITKREEHLLRSPVKDGYPSVDSRRSYSWLRI